MKVGLQKGVFHFGFSFCFVRVANGSMQIRFVLNFFRLPCFVLQGSSFGSINGLLSSDIGVIDSGPAAPIGHKALFTSPGCPRCFADLNRFPQLCESGKSKSPLKERQRPKLLFSFFLDKSCLKPYGAQLGDVVEYGLLRYSRRLGPFPFVGSFSEKNLFTTYGSGGYYGPSAIHFGQLDESGFHRCCLQFLANFNSRPFCVEMSFSLLSPLLWVICSLVQAL